MKHLILYSGNVFNDLISTEKVDVSKKSNIYGTNS